jgi:hypothetical protein
MTVDLELAERFVAYLRIHARGEDRAITAAKLCPALGLPPTAQSRRHLRAAAHHAVESGTLVCSGQNGYWIPASEDEARGTAARLRSEAHEMLKRADETERLAERAFALGRTLPAPQDLFGMMEVEACRE